jgi:hypothetical protein
LHCGLAVVLAFAGIKLLADPIIHIHPLFSVAFSVSVEILARVNKLHAPPRVKPREKVRV